MATTRTSLVASTLLALGVIAASASASAYAFDGQQYSKEAKITLEQARATALKQIPGGTITDEELEQEKGGSSLRYSFDIKAGQAEHEVGIDAKTGAVLERSVEGPNAD